MNLNKLISKLPAGFAEDCNSLDVKGLERAVLDATAALAEVDREVAEHEQLQSAKAVVRDLMGPFQDARRAQKAKIAYALHLISERGVMHGVGAASAPGAHTASDPASGQPAAPSASGEAISVEISGPDGKPVKTTLGGLARAARAVESAIQATGAEAGSAAVVR